MNIQLKVAIIQSGKKGYQVARGIWIHDTRLTKIIAGIVEPRQSEIKLLVKILGKSKAELFPEPSEVAT